MSTPISVRTSSPDRPSSRNKSRFSRSIASISSERPVGVISAIRRHHDGGIGRAGPSRPARPVVPPCRPDDDRPGGNPHQRIRPTCGAS
ncbi:MAG TPA: hypothetical protein VIZ43_19780 [Trebonia sp.]